MLIAVFVFGICMLFLVVGITVKVSECQDQVYHSDTDRVIVVVAALLALSVFTLIAFTAAKNNATMESKEVVSIEIVHEVKGVELSEAHVLITYELKMDVSKFVYYSWSYPTEEKLIPLNEIDVNELLHIID